MEVKGGGDEHGGQGEGEGLDMEVKVKGGLQKICTQSNQRFRKGAKKLGGQEQRSGVECALRRLLPIYTLPGAGQGLVPPEIRGPFQGQVARGFLGAGFLLARGHQAEEAEGDQCWGALGARHRH